RKIAVHRVAIASVCESPASPTGKLVAHVHHAACAILIGAEIAAGPTVATRPAAARGVLTPVVLVAVPTMMIAAVPIVMNGPLAVPFIVPPMAVDPEPRRAEEPAVIDRAPIPRARDINRIVPKGVPAVVRRITPGRRVVVAIRVVIGVV